MTEKENMDMINSLPDPLLCHILSFLPTKDAVATCFLSRRWRYLWKDLQVLDIDDAPFHVPELPDNQIARRVDNQIARRVEDFVRTFLDKRSNRHIQRLKFCLSSKVTEKLKHCVSGWIQAANGPYLQELHVNLSLSYFDRSREFSLPKCVFTCASLVSLALKDDICLTYLPSVHLPSLNNLELDTTYEDPDKLLSGCPVLETLKLTLRGDKYPAVHIPSSLKSLTFEMSSFGHVIEYLEMVTPSLQYLHIKLRSSCPRPLIGDFFPNMVDARLVIFPLSEHVGWVLELLKALRGTKKLVLKDFTSEFLLRAPARDFPEFRCLRKLELDITRLNPRFLIDLLFNCHMLQVLVIDNHNIKGLFCATHALQYKEPSGWTPPATFPSCVISHLKVFEFGGFNDSAEEHAFIMHISQRGLALKTMAIHTGFGFDQKKKDRILNQLSTIPRGSTTCQLKVD